MQNMIYIFVEYIISSIKNYFVYRFYYVNTNILELYVRKNNVYFSHEQTDELFLMLERWNASIIVKGFMYKIIKFSFVQNGKYFFFSN